MLFRLDQRTEVSAQEERKFTLQPLRSAWRLLNCEKLTSVGEDGSLLNLVTKMINSSYNILVMHPEAMLPYGLASLIPIQLTQETEHHKLCPQISSTELSFHSYLLWFPSKNMTWYSSSIISYFLWECTMSGII